MLKILDVHAMQARIAQVKQKAIALNDLAVSQSRDLTKDERVEYDAMTREISDLRGNLDKHAAGNTLAPGAKPGVFMLPGAAEVTEGGNKFSFKSIADFLRDGSGGVRGGAKQSLAEGSDLSLVIPSYEVDGFLRAYPNVDPFAQAGASIVDLSDNGWSEGRVPFILAGDEPSVYAEGTGPTTDESASVAVVRLNDPKKIAFLTKPTEESMEDITGLAAALGAEGIRRVYNKTTKAATADLLTSLEVANATVTNNDNYAGVLDSIGAIPSFFASTFNAFMMSRRSLALIRNTRAPGSGVPMFDSSTFKLAGYSVILNDFCPDGNVLFGSFGDAVHIRRTGLHFLQLNEAYKEAGKVGLRFHLRADWAFFSEAADNSVVDQPLVLWQSSLGS